MLLAAQSPHASDRTRATFARPEETDTTIPVSSSMTQFLSEKDEL
jgi:hypothetical protein